MVEAGMGAQSRRLSSAAAMPIYEYRCENGHLFEVMQRITEDPVTTCPDCGAAVQRVFHPVAVHFKGSGFYNTDYGTARRKREREAESAAKSDGGKSGDKKDSGSSSSGSSSESGSGSGSGTGSGSAAKAD
jgi:putative FmdB family regulatory protein